MKLIDLIERISVMVASLKEAGMSLEEIMDAETNYHHNPYDEREINSIMFRIKDEKLKEILFHRMDYEGIINCINDGEYYVIK
jgi:hypothetical protein